MKSRYFAHNSDGMRNGSFVVLRSGRCPILEKMDHYSATYVNGDHLKNDYFNGKKALEAEAVKLQTEGLMEYSAKDAKALLPACCG